MQQHRPSSASTWLLCGATGAASGAALRRPSSACFAARASGLSGATSSTCCHAFAAPSRSCLPNARTMPTFSSVFECFGSIASEWSNCASARSGWFV